MMMVVSTVLHSLSGKNEYQHVSFPTLLLMLVSGANKVGYMCTFMCMHIHKNVVHTNRNYSFSKLFTHLNKKRKAQESGQPSKSIDEIAAVQKVRRTRNTSKLWQTFLPAAFSQIYFQQGVDYHLPSVFLLFYSIQL